MPEGTGGSVEVKLDGAHLRVDARPARLVSLLRGAGGDPVLTAQREGGATHTEAVPSAARQVTFQVAGDLSVEATRGSDFVALAEASGRQVVVAFNGEVTVLPTGESGDRFALGAHEALLVPGDGTEPRVVPSDSLSDDDQDEISGAMEAAALGVTPAVDGHAADEPTQAVPVVDQPEATPAPATTPVAATPTTSGTTSKSAGTTKKGPPVTPPQKRNNNKKGKRGRPQQVAKKQAPLVPAAAAGAVAAGAAAAGAKKAGAVPAKKAATPVKKVATKATPGKSGGGRGSGGGGHDDSYEDTPGDRRFILGAVVLAALVAIVLAVFVLTGDGDETDLATDGGTTTTEAEAEPETTTSAAPASTTTAVAAATSAAPSPTTTARPPTTTAPATTTTAPATTARATTTTAAAAVAKYGLEPKSCVQNANNSITYTATIKNDSTAAFDYTIRVVFKDASGASAASSDASVSKLDAGKSVDFTATGTPNRNLANAGNCTVERVDARPSGS
ncbi:MAG: hypothetical protein M3Q68_08345 [Actinomycetota bacterium]|nr:hypothetical protein [Actinomycetota bacterium]